MARQKYKETISILRPFQIRNTRSVRLIKKGPINTLSRPFLKSTSSMGVNEKLHLTLRFSQQECCFPILCEKPPWTENICVFYFFSLLESDTFHPFWQCPEFPHYFKTFQVTCQIFSFTLVLCSPVAKISHSRPAALCLPVVFFNVSNRGVSAQQGPWGLVEGLYLTILFQRGPQNSQAQLLG